MTYDVEFTQLAMMTLYDLKGRSEDIAAWCGDAIPPFPTAPLSLTRHAQSELLWLAPNHWILRAPLEKENVLDEALKPNDAPANISIVRTSDSLVFFALHGVDLAEVMAVASPLDIHPSKLAEGSAAFSEVFGIKALVMGNASDIEIGVERSFGPMIADYLQRTIGN